MAGSKQTVAVLGASPKPERYSNKAIKLLLEHGHEVIPVHPAIPEIEGLPVVASLADIDKHVDTLTVYVSAALSTPLADAIIALNPARVIFNPGTENPSLKSALNDQGIPSEEACTLVLLNTGQF
ncbi:MAG: CoA-binding protein [Kiritimatiellales bacterium]|nr:CoA-binding protein [Kiritimatiellales bacterium]